LQGLCEGDDRNRTGVNGFAGRCVATPPRRRKGDQAYRGWPAAPRPQARVPHVPADTLFRYRAISCGRLAQLGERRLDKAEVAGSSPASPIKETPAKAGVSCLWGRQPGRRLNRKKCRISAASPQRRLPDQCWGCRPAARRQPRRGSNSPRRRRRGPSPDDSSLMFGDVIRRCCES
jgi:hypothetical protein